MLKRFDNFVNINSKQKIDFIGKGKKYKNSDPRCPGRRPYFDFKKAKEEEIVCIKIGLAYARVLSFEEISKEKAEEAFNTIMNMDERMLTFRRSQTTTGLYDVPSDGSGKIA